MRPFIPVSLVLLLTASLAMAEAEAPFVRSAYLGNLMRVELGTYAGNHAADPAVRHFGWIMAGEQNQSNQALREAARKSGISLPDKLDQRRQGTVNRLQKMKGAEFDRAYMKMMLQDHRQEIKDYETATKTGKTPAIRQYASQQLPALRKHLEMAQQTAQKIGVKAGAGQEKRDRRDDE